MEKKWVDSWEKKGFKNKKNPDLWMRFLKIFRKHSVRFFWIKGHNNNPRNERCDFLAVQASKNKDLKIDTLIMRKIKQNNLVYYWFFYMSILQSN